MFGLFRSAKSNPHGGVLSFEGYGALQVIDCHRGGVVGDPPSYDRLARRENDTA